MKYLHFVLLHWASSGEEILINMEYVSAIIALENGKGCNVYLNTPNQEPKISVREMPNEIWNQLCS